MFRSVSVWERHVSVFAPAHGTFTFDLFITDLFWATWIAVGLFSQQSFDHCYPISRCLHLFFISLLLPLRPLFAELPIFIENIFPVAAQPIVGSANRCWQLEFNLQPRTLTEQPYRMFQKPNETTSRKDFFISWGVLKRPILLNFLWIGRERLTAHW